MTNEEKKDYQMPLSKKRMAERKRQDRLSNLVKPKLAKNTPNQTHGSTNPVNTDRIGMNRLHVYPNKGQMKPVVTGFGIVKPETPIVKPELDADGNIIPEYW